MRQVTTYECEICNTSYSSEAECRACEKLGMAVELPIGTIFQYKELTEQMRSCQPDKMVLSGKIATSRPDWLDHFFAIGRNNLVGHANRPNVWICRDDGNDCITKMTWLPGLGQIIAGTPELLPPLVTPTRQRLIGFLQQMGVCPFLWDGKRATIDALSIIELSEQS